MKAIIKANLQREAEQQTELEIKKYQENSVLWDDPEAHIQVSKAKDYSNKVHQRAIFGKIFVGTYIIWLVFTGSFLYINLLESPNDRLSDAVLICMLGTTLAHVISIVYIFAKYLYPEKE